ncbi:MAG TPA: RodZ domain-containing protein [Acetobacteraceae bacterium]|nr:RodZ domain-containing protein [Acetobacteraceae bacterium]
MDETEHQGIGRAMEPVQPPLTGEAAPPEREAGTTPRVPGAVGLAGWMRPVGEPDPPGSNHATLLRRMAQELDRYHRDPILLRRPRPAGPAPADRRPFETAGDLLQQRLDELAQRVAALEHLTAPGQTTIAADALAPLRTLLEVLTREAARLREAVPPAAPETPLDAAQPGAPEAKAETGAAAQAARAEEQVVPARHPAEPDLPEFPSLAERMAKLMAAVAPPPPPAALPPPLSERAFPPPLEPLPEATPPLIATPAEAVVASPAPVAAPSAARSESLGSPRTAVAAPPTTDATPAGNGSSPAEATTEPHPVKRRTWLRVSLALVVVLALAFGLVFLNRVPTLRSPVPAPPSPAPAEHAAQPTSVAPPKAATAPESTATPEPAAISKPAATPPATPEPAAVTKPKAKTEPPPPATPPRQEAPAEPPPPTAPTKPPSPGASTPGASTMPAAPATPAAPAAARSTSVAGNSSGPVSVIVPQPSTERTNGPSQFEGISIPIPAAQKPAVPAPAAPIVPAILPHGTATQAAPPPIAVRTTADAWISVVDAQGQTVFSRLMHTGETWTPPRPGLLLTTGNAGGTELVVNGVAGKPLGAKGQVLHAVPLTPKPGPAPAKPPPAAAAPSAPAVVTPGTTTQPAPPPIAVRTTQDAWISVMDAQGQPVMSRLMHAGENWIPPRPGLLLTTGNAGGTELVVNGVAGPPLGARSAILHAIPLAPKPAQGPESNFTRPSR